jgi:hypothetical protein
LRDGIELDHIARDNATREYANIFDFGSNDTVVKRQSPALGCVRSPARRTSVEHRTHRLTMLRLGLGYEEPGRMQCPRRPLHQSYYSVGLKQCLRSASTHSHTVKMTRLQSCGPFSKARPAWRVTTLLELNALSEAFRSTSSTCLQPRRCSLQSTLHET